MLKDYKKALKYCKLSELFVPYKNIKNKTMTNL